MSVYRAEYMPAGGELGRGIVNANAAIAHKAIQLRKSPVSNNTLFGSSTSVEHEAFTLAAQDLAYLVRGNTPGTTPAVLTSLNRLSEIGNVSISSVEDFARTYFPSNPDAYVSAWVSEHVQVLGFVQETVTQARAERPIHKSHEVPYTVSVRGTARPPSNGPIYPGDFVVPVARPLNHWDATQLDVRSNNNNQISRHRNPLVLERLDPKTFGTRFCQFMTVLLRNRQTEPATFNVLFPPVAKVACLTVDVSAAVSFQRFVAAIMAISSSVLSRNDAEYLSATDFRHLAIAIGASHDQALGDIPKPTEDQIERHRDLVRQVLEVVFSHPVHQLGIADDWIGNADALPAANLRKIYAPFQDAVLRFMQEVCTAVSKNTQAIARVTEPSGAENRAHVLF